MKNSADDDRENQNGEDVAAQRKIEKVIAHGAVGQKRQQIIKAPERPAEQRVEGRNPESQVSDERNVMS